MQSAVCAIVTLVWTCLKPANGRPSGLMLTVCLKARLFLLELLLSFRSQGASKGV